MQTRTASPSLDGLWVLMVQNHGALQAQDPDGRVPVMCKSGDEMYMLTFKNAAKARQFVVDADVGEAEPRMVIAAKRAELVRLAKDAGAVGMVVDFDPMTKRYLATGALA